MALRAQKLKQDSVYNHYEVLSTLGQGAYATVYLGEHLESKERYAIKAISKSALVEKTLREVQAEIDVYEAANHQNVASLFEIIETEGAFCLVLELLSGGELFDQIAHRKTYSERDAAQIAKQILEGVNHLHELHFVHRDLKPENLLLTEEGVIKVVDFGLTRRLDESTPHLVECIGSTLYMAPEVVRRRKEDEDNKEWGYGKPADVWAIGVIVYIMLCGWAPFNAFEEEDIYEAIEAGEFSFPPDDYLKLSDSAKDFISKILVVDTAKRATCQEALEHPWIKSEGAEENNLSVTIEKVKQFQARRKFRGAIKAVKAIQRFGILKTQELSNEESAAVTDLYSRFKEMLSRKPDEAPSTNEPDTEAPEPAESPVAVAEEKVASSPRASVVVAAATAAEDSSTPSAQAPAPVVVDSSKSQSSAGVKHTVHPAVLRRLGLKAEEAQQAAECFEKWDKDGNDALDPEEFLEALNSIFWGQGKSAAFVERFANMFFSSADTNRNGSLSWPEFLEIYQRLSKLGV